MHESTGVCIFEGIMDALLYIQLLEQTLMLSLKKVFPDSYWFMADNHPKYTSNAAMKFLQDHQVAESPDCNPVENIWDELKEYQQREVNRFL